MYTILVLVSLAAAVSCHHAIPDPFGDDSVGQARIKRLGELDDSISRLVARAMNLKSALTQRLKNKEEADRKAKNILLRLDRMNVDDGVQRCADTDKDFRCRRSSKCIKNILVCDGKKDCDDGTDEDKDLCKSPYNAGQLWAGLNVFFHCSTKISTGDIRKIYFNLRIDKAEKNDLLPSVQKVDVTFIWNYATLSVHIFQTSGYYYYGNQKLVLPIRWEGTYLIYYVVLSYDGRYLDMRNFYANNMEHMCGRSVLPKEGEYQLGQEFFNQFISNYVVKY